jgi:DNA repair protein RadC
MSADPTPTADDADLIQRLSAAAEVVGVLARDHVIGAAGGYYSFVEGGKRRRRGALVKSRVV